MSRIINVTLPPAKRQSYDIFISENLLKKWQPKDFTDIVIITDSTVKKHIAATFAKRLIAQNFSVLLLAFPAGENAKTSKTKRYLEESMLKNHCDRDTLILAIGGGVVGDIAGFVAATYMRGISYIQIPTTLLAIIDSSVGGKTAINNAQGKNLIGAFWHPLAVISDISTLKTLPKNHFIAGLVEAIKIFLTLDKKSLLKTEKNIKNLLSLKNKPLISTIESAIALKAKVVEQDEKEHGLRMILNFGHTIGHALEKISNYTMLHGYAVAYGILIEAKISQSLGLLSEKNFIYIENLLASLDIKTKNLKKFDIKTIIKYTTKDKKSKSKQARYVLLKDLGVVYEFNGAYAHHVSEKIIQESFKILIGAK